MYKYIISDLDGTLIMDNGTVDKKSIEYIDDCLTRGMIDKFVIASGRHYRELSSVLSFIKNKDSVIVICSDGQYIYNYYGKIIYQFERYINEKLIVECFKCKGLIGMDIICKNQDYSITKPILKRLLRFIINMVKGDKNTALLSINIAKKLTDIEKIVLYCTNLKSLLIALNNYGCYKHRLKSGVVEILNVSKMDALKMLEDLSIISLDEAIYFGDDENDIECFKDKMKCIAMANSSKRILSLASDVTGLNNESGVYQFLKEIMIS